jgi:hypothetical protein
MIRGGAHVYLQLATHDRNRKNVMSWVLGAGDSGLRQ